MFLAQAATNMCPPLLRSYEIVRPLGSAVNQRRLARLVGEVGSKWAVATKGLPVGLVAISYCARGGAWLELRPDGCGWKL